LDKLTSHYNVVSQPNNSNSNNKLPTGLIIGGVLLAVAGLTIIFIIRNKKN